MIDIVRVNVATKAYNDALAEQQRTHTDLTNFSRRQNDLAEAAKTADAAVASALSDLAHAMGVDPATIAPVPAQS